jgi:hypothetical protein
MKTNPDNPDRLWKNFGGWRGFDGLELGRLLDVPRGRRPKNPSRVRVNHQPGQFRTGLRFPLRFRASE